MLDSMRLGSPSNRGESILANSRDYIVKFTYYHYNTGQSDNGTFKGERCFTTLKDARMARHRIIDCIENRASDAPDRETKDEMFGGDGYFKSFDGIFIREMTETRIK